MTELQDASNIGLFDLPLTVICPHCGERFDVNYYAVDVIATNEQIGICPRCSMVIIVHLVAREW